MRTVDTERRAAAHDAVASDAVRPDRPGAAGPTGPTSPVAAPRPGVELSAQGRAERSTRARVARLILELGPSTASVIGGRLGLTPAAIRRHLDNLLAEGLIETRTARTYASRGRGRPARLFAITDAGRSAFEHTYDDLASSALRFLAQEAGPAAVEKFARHQVSELERRYGAVLADAAPADRVRALADALSADGYAASAYAAPAAGEAAPAGPAGAVGPAAAGEQLCQHHCPVAHVAAEFPQLCEAETEAFGRLLGRPVQRLATIAYGDGICTTHVTGRALVEDPAPQGPAPSPHPYSTTPDRPRRVPPSRGMGGTTTSAARHQPGDYAAHEDARRNHFRVRRALHMTTTTQDKLDGLGTYKFGWADSDVAGAAARRGLSEDVVRDISGKKNEPEWMLDLRLRGLRMFGRKPMPAWGADLSGIDFENIKYFVRSTEKQAASWDELPDDIKSTYDKLGIPEAEKQRLIAGVAAQYESEVVYHKIREDLEEKGVIFLDTDTALREHPELFQEYFGTVIPPGDNKFAALNTAVWSGGSFIYVPKGVHVDIPLQAYFRINTENMGQFERTLIIVDEGAYVHYVEGCTAPIYKSDSLHSAVVEIIVKKDARCRYTTIQNWSNNVYNLVTKRAIAEQGATMEWIDGNIGSKVTMKYPAVYLMGEHAKGETLSVAFAGEGQHQDAGAKMVHCAPNTSSTIVSKSVARGGGRTSYRGLVNVQEGAEHSRSTVKCDALLVDAISRSDTYPYVDVREDDVEMGHEASVSKISEDQLFYLMSRGMTEDEAMATIVRGFVEPIARELPMEYALELNRLIVLQMEGAVG